MTGLEDKVRAEIEKIVESQTRMTLGDLKLVITVKQIKAEAVEIRFVSLRPFWTSCLRIARDMKRTAENVEGVKKATVYCYGHTFRQAINASVNHPSFSLGC